MHLHLLLWSHNYQNLFSVAKYHSCVCQAVPADVISLVVHQIIFFSCLQSIKIICYVSLTLDRPLSLLQLLCIWVHSVWCIICRLITFSLDILFTINYFSVFLLGAQCKYSTLLPLPFVCVFKMHSWIIALPEPLLHPQEWLARLAAVSRVCLANPLIALCIQCCEP